VKLPDDEGIHAEEVEWWYWTGHLKDEQGRLYGFQVTFFLFGVTEYRARLANVAVTDIGAGKHETAAKFQFGKPADVKGGFDFALGGHTAKGGGGHDVVHADIEGYTLDLKLDTDRRVVLQHGDGYHAYDFGGYTYYYSRPRMAATGTLKVGDEVRKVSGIGWFDHQWGDLAAVTGLGWDWFAIGLDDGRDIMAFVVHAAGGDLMVGGTVTGPDCVTTELKPGEFKVTPGKAWVSAKSKCAWKLGWDVEVQGMKLKLVPEVLDQEMYNSNKPEESYWEGSARVEGDAKGRAYVELAGCTTQT